METIKLNIPDIPFNDGLNALELADLFNMQRKYEDNVRDDVCGIVQKAYNGDNPQLILDVGCNMGATGLALKNLYPNARVMGIEPHLPSAEIATKRLDKVFAVTSDKIDWTAEGIAPGSVDIIILPDVLEHMYNPWSELNKFKSLLKPGVGKLVASIPNARFLPYLHMLAAGDFVYAKQGVTDATHIRWFTFNSLKRMFVELGYRVININFRGSKNYSKALRLDSIQNFSIDTGVLVLPNQSPLQRRNLSAIQFIATVEVPLSEST